MTAIPVNYDEDAVGVIDLPPLLQDGESRDLAQARIRLTFARMMYGEIPAPPDKINISRRILPPDIAGTRSEVIEISMSVGNRTLQRSGVLWLPDTCDGPVPVIVGLNFLGPAGVTPSPSVPLDTEAWIDGAFEGHPVEAIRGMHAHRWPIGQITQEGCGLFLSGYGGWVPDHPQKWRACGLWPLLQPSSSGAISLWAWAIMRMVDALHTMEEIDPRRIIVAGHSRLGKAALWAAVHDTRIQMAFINNAGCCGVSLSRRNFGETPRHIVARYPHWFAPGFADCADDPGTWDVDQHHLLGCMAPRPLYVASARDDLWADPKGEELAVQAARPMWGETGDCVGHHVRDGGHDLTPLDWRRFLAWMRENGPFNTTP